MVLESVEKTQAPPLPEDTRKVELTENSYQVFKRRYMRRNSDGQSVETVEQTFWRVAYHVAAAEAEKEWDQDFLKVARQFYDLLAEKRFLPNSPTFTGAGTPLGQLAACFVLPLSDDMGRWHDGIFQTLRNAALIQQTGGGNGFAFSRLRPAGSIIKTSSGKATGPVGFLSVYDKAFGEIAQGGTRRGANMSVLRVDHPDIEEFITCKTDENAITNFNISVGITDAFMQAVENDDGWDLRFPDVDHPDYRKYSGTIEQAVADGIPIKTYQRVRARELFDKIVSQAHHNGEPGVLFLDAANRANPVPQLYTLEATNPCFVGETRISTEFGLVRFDELADMECGVYISTDNRALPHGCDIGKLGVALRHASPAWMTRANARVMRLTTKMGYSVTATLDHRFLAPEGYVSLDELKPGDQILLQSGEGAWSRETSLPNHEIILEIMANMALSGDHASGQTVQRSDFRELYSQIPTEWSHDLGLVMGYLVGDGWISERSGTPLGMVFSDDEILEIIHEPLSNWFGGGHLHHRGSVKQLSYGKLPFEFFRTLGVCDTPSPEKRIPEYIWSAPRFAVVGFLQGLFSADGSVQVNTKKKDCTVRLASSSKGLLEETQILLANFGIISRIYRRRSAGTKMMPDGKGGLAEYSFHAQYDLVIGKVNRDRFAEMIGFIDQARQKRLLSFIRNKKRRSNVETFVDVVRSVEDAGYADVYDLSQPQTQSLLANGLVAHNCGEQFLGPYENCCLGSVNLAQHLGPDGTVDWLKLRATVELSTRFLDNVVDANAYVPDVPELRQAALNARRIGLGIMGLGDLMYHAGIRYGSPEGQEFAAQVMEFVRYHAMLASIKLAKTRRAFPAITGSIYDPANITWEPPKSIVPYKHNWDRPEVDWDEVVAGIRKHGIRNAAQTTIAPTGTIATVAGCEGYGCEPVFALAYVRHVDDNGVDLELTYTSPLFEKALVEAGLEEDERGRLIEQVLESGTCQNVEMVPEHLQNIFVVSQDITAVEHIRMQAALQAFVDNSLSKTINFPEDALVEDVATAYKLAWESGCKGITVYVTGSRQKVVLETKTTAKEKENGGAAITPEAAQLSIWHETKKPRPRRLRGYTYNVNTPLGKAFVTVNENGGEQPFEVFINTAKAGSDTAAVSEAIGRLLSYTLRLASPIEPRERLQEIVHQLSGIGGGRPLGFGPNRVRSLPDGVSQALREYLENTLDEYTWREADRDNGQEPGESLGLPLDGPEESHQSSFKIGDLCPDCGQAALVNEEGCRKCYACGYSEC